MRVFFPHSWNHVILPDRISAGICDVRLSTQHRAHQKEEVLVVLSGHFVRDVVS